MLKRIEDDQLEVSEKTPAFALRPLLIALAVLSVLLTWVYLQLFPYMSEATPPVVRSLARMFDVNGESTIPSWFSSLLWALSSFLACIVAMNRSASGGRHVTWYALSALFLLLSLDEAAMLHENVGDGIDLVIKGSGPFAWMWILYGAAVFVVGGLLFLRLFTVLRWPARLLFSAGAVVFVSGALGVEMYSAAIWDRTIVFEPGWDWPMILALEEFLEMAGVVLNLWALATVLAGAETAIRFRW